MISDKTVRLHLPQSLGADLAEATAARDHGASPTGSETVLVVEDDALVRE